MTADDKKVKKGVSDMATIALYSGKANMMPWILRDLKSSVRDYRDDVEDLGRRAAAIDSGICDLSQVIDSLRSSSDTQEAKADLLSEAAEMTEQFLDDVEEIDEDAAEAITDSKNDFYDTYEYLRPECEKEKTFWDKVGDGLKKVGEWCKDHWKAIATVILVAVAIVVIVVSGGTALGPLAALAVTLAKGVLIGTVVGGIMGGIVGAVSPNSTFWEGLENGAFGGALGGLITGGLGSAVSAISGVAELSLVQTMLVSGAGDTITSILTNLGDQFIKGDNISIGQYISDALFSFGTGVLFAGLGDYLGKHIPPLKINGLNKGRGSWKFDWMYGKANVGRSGNPITIRTILKGMGADFIDGVIDHGIELLKGATGEGYDAYKDAVSA